MNIYDLKVELEGILSSQMIKAFRGYLAKWREAGPEDRSRLAREYSDALAREYNAHHLHIASIFDGDKSMVPLIGETRMRAGSFVRGLQQTVDAAESEAGKDAGITEDKKTRLAVGVGLRHLKARIPANANFETQPVVETVRKEIARQEGDGPLRMDWTSRMDGKERPAHHAAHQMYHGFRSAIDIQDVFVVAGEQLRFPGDTRLGASMRNTINCRCWANFYDQHGEIVSRTVSIDARRVRRRGDRVGSEIQGTPTTVTTLTDGVRNVVVLSDGKTATVIRRGNEVRVIRNRRRLGTIRLDRQGGVYTIQSVTASGGSLYGADALVQRSLGGIR